MGIHLHVLRTGWDDGQGGGIESKRLGRYNSPFAQNGLWQFLILLKTRVKDENFYQMNVLVAMMRHVR